MAKSKEKQKTKPNVNKETKHELDVEHIVELGGEKKDLSLFEDLSDNEGEEVYDPKEDLDAEPINRNELRDFIHSLGFNKVTKLQVVDEDESEDPGDDTEPKTTEKQSTEKPSPEKKKSQTKEKKKNKHKETVQDHDDDELKTTEEQSTEKPSPEKKKSPKIEKKRNKYKKTVQDHEISSTTPSTSAVSASGQFEFVKVTSIRKYLLAKSGKWANHMFQDDPQVSENAAANVVQILSSYAAKLYNDEIGLFKTKQEASKKSDVTWIKTVMKSGTLPDKMAALTLLVQDAPVQNLHSLDQLITTVKKKGRREALMAIDTLKELFLSDLLCDDRKLKPFEMQPLSQVEVLSSGNKDSRDKRLLMWYFEAQLKLKYLDFVKALEVMCHDNISEAKGKALGVVFALLAGNPEQEQKLLSILTNKLGDPDYKIASRAAHFLTKLVEKHPNMRHIVVTDVERLMYRPNISNKAQYYAVCFLNQVILDVSDKDLAIKLITIYFSFFKVYVKKGEVDSKMLNALLTGVNRSYPYAKGNMEKISEHVDTLYKIIHIVNFNTAVQALMLLYQVMDSSDHSSDRYYQALYRKMMDPGLLTCSKQSIFLNLLFRSMKKDTVDRRVKSFVKRLLQICGFFPAQVICGSLLLLSEVVKSKPSLFQFTQTSQESEDEEEHYADIKMEGEDGSLSATSEESGSEEEMTPKTRKQQSSPGATHAPASWVHRLNIKSEENTTSKDYDPQCRNPMYSHAETECMWELEKLAHHFHPSVSLFANNILHKQSIKYDGNPLDDFTLIRFLDRFVFRNPKKSIKVKAGGTVHSRLSSRHKPSTGARGVAVNTEDYLKTSEQNIPVEEKFFYRYFTKQAEKKQAEAEKEDSDVESVEDDEFEDFLDKFEERSGFGGDLDLDFASVFTKDQARKGTEASDTEDDDDDDEEDDDLSDEEIDFADDMKKVFIGMDEEEDGSDDSHEDMDDDVDEEDISFSDDELMKSSSGPKKRRAVEDQDPFVGTVKSPGRKQSKYGSADGASLFAAAEEFSYVIDDTSGTRLDAIGTDAVATNDNASLKQLKWEAKREQWMTGKDWKSEKRGKSQKPHGKFSKKGSSKQFHKSSRKGGKKR